MTDDGQFVTSSTQLHAAWTAVDDGNGITEYQYAVGTTSGGSDVLGWTSAGTAVQATITGLALTDGATYYVSVKALGGDSVWSGVGSSDGIIVDTTKPVCEVRDLPAVVGKTSFAIFWNDSDAGSGLDGRVDIQVMDAETGAWINWKTNITDASALFEGLDGHTYYFQCRALDNAGNWSDYPGGFGDASTQIKIENIPITGLNDGAGADIDFTSDTSTFSANWDAAPGAVAYMYAIGTTPGDANVVGWTRAQQTSFTVTGLALVHGSIYYVSVSSVNDNEYVMTPAVSDGVLVDITAPDDPNVNVVDAQIASTTSIQAYWSSTDEESGIAGYTVSIGTAQGLTDTMASTSVGIQTSQTFSALSLVNGGTYFVNVSATNNAGLTGQVVSSAGVAVSTALLPEPGSVSDGLGADADYSSSLTTLSANWTAVAGAATYEYQIGTTPGGGDTKTWTSAGAATSVTDSSLALSHGVKYFVTVRGKDGVGTAGADSTSNGIVVDTTAPSTPVVEDEGLLTNNAAKLSATWVSEEPESGITLYEYAVGTTASAQDVKGWTSAGTSESVTIDGLSLAVGGTYFIQVRATNGAGLTSVVGASNGITRVFASDISIVSTPVALVADAEADGTADCHVSLTFTENNGVPVSFFQVQRFYVMDNGMEIEEPAETLSFEVNGAASKDFDFSIPADVVAHAIGGRAQADATIRLVFTGYDASSNEVTSRIDISTNITAMNTGNALVVGTIDITAPVDGTVLSQDTTNVASAEIDVNGSGALSGYWELDGRPYKQFQSPSVTGSDIMVSMNIPSDIGGTHTLVVKIISPEVKESAPVTFVMKGDVLQASDMSDFWAGPLHITNVQAVVDQTTGAYSGSGLVKYKDFTVPARLPFRNIIIEQTDGKNSLTGGVIAADAGFTLERDAIKIVIERLKVTTSEAVADGIVHFEGSGDVPGIGPLHFYSAKLSANGISGVIDLEKPVSGSIGIFGLSINRISVKYDDSGLDMTAAGLLTAGTDVSINLQALIAISQAGATFTVGDAAGAGSGVKAADNNISFGGFTFHVESGQINDIGNVLSMSLTGTLNMDIGNSPLAGGGDLSVRFNRLTVTSDGNITGGIAP